jgi:hypothetical protein
MLDRWRSGHGLGRQRQIVIGARKQFAQNYYHQDQERRYPGDPHER